MVATRNTPARRPLTIRQDVFAKLVVQGETQDDAYRRAYHKPKASDKTAREAGCRVANHPAVKARLAELRGKAEAPTIMSLSNRLGKLAAAAEFKPKSAADRNALARVIEVYNKTAGDHAPDRQEVVVKGDATQPVAVMSVTLTKKQKIAALVAARAGGATPPSP